MHGKPATCWPDAAPDRRPAEGREADEELAALARAIGHPASASWSVTAPAAAATSSTSFRSPSRRSPSLDEVTRSRHTIKILGKGCGTWIWSARLVRELVAESGADVEVLKITRTSEMVPPQHPDGGLARNRCSCRDPR